MFTRDLTEVMVRFRQPPVGYSTHDSETSYMRLRISPDVVIALGMMVMDKIGQLRADWRK